MRPHFDPDNVTHSWLDDEVEETYQQYWVMSIDEVELDLNQLETTKYQTKEDAELAIRKAITKITKDIKDSYVIVGTDTDREREI